MKKCHRIECNEQAKIGIRDRSGRVLVFCEECFESLVRSDVINGGTGQILMS
jgi:hypothetical protein